MRKLIFLWIALVVVSLQALANDKVSFTASAPDAVAVGDQFRAGIYSDYTEGERFPCSLY